MISGFLPSPLSKLLVTLIFWAAIVSFYVPLYAGENPYSLTKVEGDVDSKGSVVTMRFDRKLDLPKPEVEDHGSFMQLSLPETVTAHPGQFYEASGPYVDKMAVFQVGPKSLALRLFVNEKADLLKKASSVDLLDDRLMLFIDHAKLEGMGIKKHLEKVKGQPSAEEVVANAKVSSDILDPAEEVKTDGSPALSFGKDDLQLDGKMTSMAIFSAVMLAGLVFMQITRRFFRRKRRQDPGAPSLTIKTVASHALAPKHKITVVQVGGQQVLLGVSPEGISYLTTIGQPRQEMPTAMAFAPQAPAPALKSAQDLYREAALESEKKVKVKEAPQLKIKSGIPESSFSIGIDDEGIKTLNSHSAKTPNTAMTQKSIEDVTNLIRRKLKNLPSLG